MTLLHPAKPTGTHTTPIGFVMPPIPLAESDFFLTPFNFKTVFREQFTPFVKLLFPNESFLGTSVPWTSLGSRVTNVQEAPRKEDLRSVGFATVMNPFEFSSSLVAP